MRFYEFRFSMNFRSLREMLIWLNNILITMMMVRFASTLKNNERIGALPTRLAHKKKKEMSMLLGVELQHRLQHLFTHC